MLTLSLIAKSLAVSKTLIVYLVTFQGTPATFFGNVRFSSLNKMNLNDRYSVYTVALLTLETFWDSGLL